MCQRRETLPSSMRWLNESDSEFDSDKEEQKSKKTKISYSPKSAIHPDSSTDL